MITAINARLAGLLTAAAIVVAAVLYVSSLSRRLEAAQEQLRSEVSRAEAAEAGAALMAERLSELIADKEAGSGRPLRDAEAHRGG